MQVQLKRNIRPLLILGLVTQLGGCLLAAAGYVGYNASQKKQNQNSMTAPKPAPTNNTATTPTPTPTNTSKASYPRVIISIPEFQSNDKTPVSDPAAETEFTKTFLSQGFKLVDKKQAEKAWKDDVIYKLDKEEDLKAAAALAFKLGAEILIIGKAFSEKSSGTLTSGVVVNINARIDIKAIRADTGEIIWADSQTARATDSTELIASKKALAKAGQELAPRISAKIISADYRTAGSRIEVVLAYPGGKLSLSDAKKFKEGLKKVEGVKEIIDREFNAGVALFDVVYQGSANGFAEAIDSQTIGERSCSINKITAAKVFIDLK
jgi:hypothetical protein